MLLKPIDVAIERKEFENLSKAEEFFFGIKAQTSLVPFL